MFACVYCSFFLFLSIDTVIAHTPLTYMCVYINTSIQMYTHMYTLSCIIAQTDGVVSVLVLPVNDPPGIVTSTFYNESEEYNYGVSLAASSSLAFSVKEDQVFTNRHVMHMLRRCECLFEDDRSRSFHFCCPVYREKRRLFSHIAFTHMLNN